MEGPNIYPGMESAHMPENESTPSQSSGENPTTDRNKSYFTDVKKGEVNELMNVSEQQCSLK